MTIRSQFLSELFSVFYDPDKHPGSELVTYTPHGGTPKVIPAIVRFGNRGSAVHIDGVNAGGAHGTIRIQASGPDGIETVTNKDTVLIGAVTWHIGSPYQEQEKVRDGSEWVLGLYLDSLEELHMGFNGL